MTAADAPRRLYGRRKGKRLRPGQEALLHEVLPRWAIAAPQPGRIVDPHTLFEPAPRAVWLEIGFGGGEHLAAQARAHPDLGLIGCEPFINGMVKLLAELARNGLGNVRILPDDARPLLDVLAPASIGRVFVLFPDPWPKKRHHKRRLVSAATLDALGRIMVDGAELRLATDDPAYHHWILEQLAAHGDFTGPAGGPEGLAERPSDWPATRYETKAQRRGARPVYLIYRRRARV